MTPPDDLPPALATHPRPGRVVPPTVPGARIAGVRAPGNRPLWVRWGEVHDQMWTEARAVYRENGWLIIVLDGDRQRWVPEHLVGVVETVISSVEPPS